MEQVREHRLGVLDYIYLKYFYSLLQYFSFMQLYVPILRIIFKILLN